MIAKDRNAYISRARENMDPDVALARIARGSPLRGFGDVYPDARAVWRVGAERLRVAAIPSRPTVS